MTASMLISADAVRFPSGVIGDAVLVEAGNVVAVGNRRHLTRPGVPEQRYPGAVLIPGLRDAHIHPVGYAVVLNGLSLDNTPDFEGLRQRLRRAAAASPERPLLGLRLDDQTLLEKRLPTRRDIDTAVSDQPVLLERYCGHVAVANSAALASAGVDADTADPPGGRIDRDASGAPNGILRETAIELMAAQFEASDIVRSDDVVAALRGLAGLGITSIGAMLNRGNGPWTGSANEVATMIAASSDVPIRAHALVITEDTAALVDAAQRLAAAGPRLRWLGLKLFADGSLGGHTAAMEEAYVDLPGERGTLRLTDANETTARATLAMGGHVAVHAIGDRAATAVLDMFGRLVDEGAAPGTLRIEHASVLASTDIARISSLGVSACVQPAFIESETTWLEARIGSSRLQHTYAFASMAEAGVNLAGSSDCPVEAPHPLWGMALARDRVGLVPEESLSPEQALALFTTGAARSLGEPAPLTPGSPADLVALDRDPVESSPDELRGAVVLETFVDGVAVDVDPDRSVWIG